MQNEIVWFLDWLFGAVGARQIRSRGMIEQIKNVVNKMEQPSLRNVERGGLGAKSHVSLSLAKECSHPNRVWNSLHGHEMPKKRGKLRDLLVVALLDNVS
jgi:hypothetical protein